MKRQKPICLAGLFWEKSTVDWFGLREKYCWRVSDNPNERGEVPANDWGLTTHRVIVWQPQHLNKTEAHHIKGGR
jgi:hypothetical protein